MSVVVNTLWNIKKSLKNAKKSPRSMSASKAQRLFLFQNATRLIFIVYHRFNTRREIKHSVAGVRSRSANVYNWSIKTRTWFNERDERRFQVEV